MRLSHGGSILDKRLICKPHHLVVGQVCAKLLKLLPPRASHFATKPVSDLHLVTMMGRKNRHTSIASLCSLCHAWTEIPRLTLYSDGSLGLAKLQALAGWWPAQLTCRGWEEAVQYNLRKGREPMATFARKKMSGRKLAICLAEGEQDHALWVDLDILWYKPLPEIPERRACQPEGNPPIVKMSEDWKRSYCSQLVLGGWAEELRKTPVAYNSGVSFIQGNLYDTFELSRPVEIIADCPDAKEQTIQAVCSKRLGVRPWTSRQICMPCHLNSGEVCKEAVAAIHYTAPNLPIMRRDALLLTLKRRFYSEPVKLMRGRHKSRSQLFDSL